MDSEANDYQNSQMARRGAEESLNNSGLAQPNILPKMTCEEVKARAKRIFDKYGRAPYKNDTIGDPFYGSGISDDCIAVISEFVYYWQPYFSERGKGDGSSS